MLMSFRNLVLLSATLCTTAAFAAEQKMVKVPFSFVAKDHAYPAGSYTVAVDWTKSLVTLSRVGKPSQPLTWIMLPGVNDRHPQVSLTFDVVGSNHVLKAIRYEAFTTPDLDTHPTHKIESSSEIGD
jgi:hypothetical protein